MLTYHDVEMDPGSGSTLMMAVVLRALHDAMLEDQPPLVGELSRPDSMSRRDARADETARLRDDARDWLLNDNDDFREIAELAGQDPDELRRKARALERNGWKTPLAA